MGTRNLITVVLNGEFKVAQYSQWDGYPGGQGAEICNFLQNELDLDTFRLAVNNCRFLTDKEVEQRWGDAGANLNDKNGFVDQDVSDNFKKNNQALSRDTGAKVLKLIQDGVRELQNNIEFSGDSLFCEWAYVVDLDNHVLEIYKGFNKKPLDPSERFYAYALSKEAGRGEYYYPIKLAKKLSFIESTKEAMSKLSAELNRDED